jgi:hypothetical protein
MWWIRDENSLYLLCKLFIIIIIIIIIKRLNSVYFWH